MAFPSLQGVAEINHIPQHNAILDNGMIVMPGEKILDPMGKHKSATLIKRHRQGTVPCSHQHRLSFSLVEKLQNILPYHDSSYLSRNLCLLYSSLDYNKNMIQSLEGRIVQIKSAQMPPLK